MCLAVGLHVNKFIAHNSGSYMHTLVQQHTPLNQTSVQAQHALLQVVVHNEHKLMSSEATWGWPQAATAKTASTGCPFPV